MEKDIFAPYEIVKQLKELGFDEPCMAYYAIMDEEDEEDEDDEEIRLFIEVDYCPSTNIINISDDCDFYNYNTTDYISTPTWEQVFKWFREKGYDIGIKVYNKGKDRMYKPYIIVNGRTIYTEKLFPTYEQARENLALELIEIYKNEQRIDKK